MAWILILLYMHLVGKPMQPISWPKNMVPRFSFYKTKYFADIRQFPAYVSDTVQDILSHVCSIATAILMAAHVGPANSSCWLLTTLFTVKH